MHAARPGVVSPQEIPTVAPHSASVTLVRLRDLSLLTDKWQAREKQDVSHYESGNDRVYDSGV
jgi:hypothetical protein